MPLIMKEFGIELKDIFFQEGTGLKVGACVRCRRGRECGRGCVFGLVSISKWVSPLHVYVLDLWCQSSSASQGPSSLIPKALGSNPQSREPNNPQSL